MKAYLRAFVNYKQDNWARLLLMAKFAYNNTKHASMGYTPFEFNCKYHACVFYKEDVDPHSRSKAADKLTKELRNLMTTYKENLQQTQELQKRAHNKGTKFRSNVPSKKFWLNSKYIKNKCNRKLEIKFFGSFRVLHSVDSQAYKLELPKQWRIYNVFHISLLEQDIIKKWRVDKKTAKQLEFEAGGNNKEYKVEGICNSALYARELETGQLPGFYYLVSWKGYLEDESTWKPISAMQHLRKLVSIFYKNHPNILTVTSPPINLAPPMAKCTTSPNVNSKRKRG